jgi:hypothetical protein
MRIWPATGGNAIEDSGFRQRGETCVLVEIPLTATSRVPGATGNAFTGFGRAASPASRSRCVRTAFSNLRAVIGTATEVTKKGAIRA